MASAGPDQPYQTSYPASPDRLAFLFPESLIMNNALTDNTIPTDTLVPHLLKMNSAFVSGLSILVVSRSG
jgi:hypothetical protein